MKRFNSPRLTRQNPNTQPALKAVTKPLASPSVLLMHEYAVLILAVTATRMPIHPELMLVKAPRMKAPTVHISPNVSSTKTPMMMEKSMQKTNNILYSSYKKALAPSETAFLIVTMVLTMSYQEECSFPTTLSCF